MEMSRYIADMQRLVRHAKAEGIPLPKLLNSAIVCAYQNLGVAQLFKWKLEYMFTQEKGNQTQSEDDLP